MKEFVFDISKWFVGLTPTKMVIALLLGITIGSLALFGSYYLGVEKQKQGVIEQMKIELAECARVRGEFSALKTDFILVKASQDQIPMPRWIKNLDLKMIWVNRRYEEKYLRPLGLTAAEYISNYDSYAFDEVTALQFNNNDKLVIGINRPKTFIEIINGKEVRVLKYPFKIGETVFGVGGIEVEQFD